jgi:cobalamin-dependent methionine synthase I
MRNQYSRLKFGRSVVENKFKVLKAAVSRAFEDTGIDPEEVIVDYVKLKLAGEFTSSDPIDSNQGGNRT